jgi:predicted nuclease with TOPRIM domain
MTSQKTIERCREKVANQEREIAELKESNQTLLDNNVKLVDENSRLTALSDSRQSRIFEIEKEKEDCTNKCKTIVSQKDQIILQKQTYINNLKNTVWHLKNSFICKTYEFHETPDGFGFGLEFQRKP